MFDISQRGSTVGREILGGITTFMAMSYIVFVQYALLGQSEAPGMEGMDPRGVMLATCIASAVACFLMAILANYPIALAPGMGENFFFLAIAGVMAGWSAVAMGWHLALALTVLAGLFFLLVSAFGLRSRVLNSIPDALKSGISAGIGLLIARVGFDWAGFATALAPAKLGAFRAHPEAWLALIGLAVTLGLLAFRIRGAILLGILVTTGVAVLVGRTEWQNPVGWPEGLGTTAGGFYVGLEQLWSLLPRYWLDILTMGFILLFMDLFDTVGTLVGVSRRAGLMRGGTLPKAERALAADAAGTVVGGCLGTSTVTSYIESITGVTAGARTGLAAIVAGVCMLGAIFFQPLAEVVTGAATGAQLFPTLAPALIVVGAMMLRTVRDLDWDDVTEYLPAFLTMLTMPLTRSISAGIAIGFVSYAVAKLLRGRPRQCPVLVYVFAVLFVVQYVLSSLRAQ
jgi:AGZA family xanthine/uracil permease-like MFS transporter